MPLPPVVSLLPDVLPPFVAARWAGHLPTLWARGNLELLARPLVAVIGTRRPSARGARAARAWARGVVEAGGVVLSGGALGVDMLAHQSAWDAGGATVIVPAEGLDHYGTPLFLPRPDWRRLLLCTNLAPEETGSRSAPVLRNSVVAALADAVIVVETPARGGTAYVVREARRRAAPLMAVEYRVGGENAGPPSGREIHESAGGNLALLLSGATALPERPGSVEIESLRDLLPQACAARPGTSPQADFFDVLPEE